MSPKGKYSEMKSRAVAVGIAAGLVSAMAILTLSHTPAEARRMVLERPAEPSPVVARIAESASVDPVKARSEMLGVYHRDALQTAADYRTAAKLFEKSDDQSDILLAHDFALASLALGDGESKPIIARTEDRLFEAAGLGERYGTLGGKALPLTENHRQLFKENPLLMSVSVRPNSKPAG